MPFFASTAPSALGGYPGPAELMSSPDSPCPVVFLLEPRHLQEENVPAVRAVCTQHLLFLHVPVCSMGVSGTGPRAPALSAHLECLPGAHTLRVEGWPLTGWRLHGGRVCGGVHAENKGQELGRSGQCPEQVCVFLVPFVGLMARETLMLAEVSTQLGLCFPLDSVISGT